MARTPTTVVFDVGNVLIRWDPRNLYRRLFDDKGQMEWFLGTVCHHDWNLEQDRGRSWAEAVDEAIARHPEWASHIRAFDERWPEMLAGPVAANVALLERLRAAGVPTYGITNFSSAKFRDAQKLFPFLDRFDGLVVSGDEGLLKPDPAIYRRLLTRYALEAGDCVFIDDSPANVRGAEAVGMQAILFAEPMDLGAALRERGIAAA